MRLVDNYQILLIFLYLIIYSCGEKQDKIKSEVLVAHIFLSTDLLNYQIKYFDSILVVH